MQLHEDTIAAISTPHGVGAIHVIRMSGKEAIAIANTCFNGVDLYRVQTHTIHYGHIMQHDEIIDEVMLSIMLAPRTYTREDTVEISTHGAPYIAERVLQVLLDLGARQARAGEFTQRAFLNGRIDLSQAEAVADMIASETQAQAQLSLQALKGDIFVDLQNLRTQLLDFISLLELELDFSEEYVEFANRSQLSNLLQAVSTHLSELLVSFQYGNAVKQGINVVIVGKPNAGKSTLLNTLVQDERAIVSAAPGTTRDTIEENIIIDGVLFRLIDTAGLRHDVDNEIEQIGIKRTFFKMQQAHIIIHVIDIHDIDTASKLDDLHRLINKEYKEAYIITAINKIDEKAFAFPILKNTVLLSAKNKINIDELKGLFSNYVSKQKQNVNTHIVIHNIRHKESLSKALEAIKNASEALSQNKTADMITSDIRIALYHIGEVTGVVTNDEILGNIFSKFCIGK